jgi:Uma2 family endonuclease
MSDAEFAEFCSEHPDLSFEMTAEGEIIAMPPPYTLTGIRCGEITFQLETWNRKGRRGVCIEASGGFVLPSGARRSPDAAWISGARLAGMTAQRRNWFWRVCPNFVVELKSDNDRLRTVRAKMAEWIENGAELGWLIDPERRTAEIFRPGVPPETHVGMDQIFGEGPVAGFALDLQPVWEPPSVAEHAPNQIF